MVTAAVNLDPPEVAVLIARGQAVVERIARKIRRGLDSSYQLDDLVAAGQLGLLEAARRFDPTQNVAFEAFAYLRIRGEIYNEVGRFSELKGTAYHRAVALDATTRKYGNDACEAKLQIAALDNIHDMPEARAEAAFANLMDAFSSATALGLLKPALETEIADESGVDLESAVERRQLVTMVLELLDDLDPIDAKIFRRKLSADLAFEDLTAEFGMSQPWLVRRYNRALTYLQKRMRRLT